MKEEQKEFFEVGNSFRRLNFSSMLPNISHGDFGILKVIKYCRENCEEGAAGVKVSNVVKCSGLPAPAISRTLRHLEEKDYVVRTVDKDDRRNTFVEVTLKGEELLSEVDGIMADFADAVFGQMGDDTMQKLNRYFRRLVETSAAEIEKRKYKGKKGETLNETHI